jgi:hypothetical protein
MMMNLGIVDRMKTCLSPHAVIILLSCETVHRIGKKLDVDYLVSDFLIDHFAVNTYMFEKFFPSLTTRIRDTFL